MAKGKFLSGLQEFLIGFVAPNWFDNLAAQGTGLLEEAYTENPELITNLLKSLYPLIDVYAERAVAKTKTKLDDKAVQSIKTALEGFASSKGIELPNLDEGQADD